MKKENTSSVESASKEARFSNRIAIKVEENGDFLINGKKEEIDALKPELLEQIVDASLEDRVDYEIDGETPVASFFHTLMQGTNPESDLRKIYLVAIADTDVDESETEVQSEIDSEIEG